MLKPYADSVNRNMNDVIAVSSVLLEKKQPEGNLGNLLADAMLAMAKEKYDTRIDASFVNPGGIRLPAIPAGNITRGKIYELSPFDNIIVLLRLKGQLLQEFLDHTAARGGWPCAGISYRIKNKKAVDAVIAGKVLQPDGAYTIALVDYVANGGDNSEMLKTLAQENNGYLFRDAVLEYLARLQQAGKNVTAAIEKRVTYAD
jgi:2',3'-cyclic-nucleotide 2'-phosphodiesterase (5'-nucleotidase family)